MFDSCRPTWAVVIPAYNEATRITDALDSLQRQTEPPDEIVVCDDGSTDDLDAALKPFTGGFRLVRQENRGLSAARNAGAAEVISDWILFLDADDHLAPDFLELLRDIAKEQPHLGIIGSEAEGYDDVDGQVLYRHYRDRETFPWVQQRKAILNRNFFLTGISVRREQWIKAGRFDERFRYCEDWDCWLRMVLRGAQAGLAEHAILYRRQHGRSMSANRDKMLRWRLAVLEQAVEREELNDDEREVALKAIDGNLRALRALESRLAVQSLARTDCLSGQLSSRVLTLRLAVSRHVGFRHRLLLAVATVLPFPGHLLPARVTGVPNRRAAE